MEKWQDYKFFYIQIFLICMQVEALDASLPLKLHFPYDVSVTTEMSWRIYDIK